MASKKPGESSSSSNQPLPKGDWSTMQQAYCVASDGNYQEAMRLIRELHDKHKDTREIYMYEALIHSATASKQECYSKGKEFQDQAIRCTRKVIELDPTAQEPRKYLKHLESSVYLELQIPDSIPLTIDMLSNPAQNASSSGIQEQRLEVSPNTVLSLTSKKIKVEKYWNSLNANGRKNFLKVGIQDLKAHFTSSEALMLFPSNNNVEELITNTEWLLWECCQCDEKFPNPDSHFNHVWLTHFLGQIPPDYMSAKSVSPVPMNCFWVSFAEETWIPRDTSRAVQLIEKSSSAVQLIENSLGRHLVIDARNFCLELPTTNDSDRSFCLKNIQNLLQVLLIKNKVLSVQVMEKVAMYITRGMYELCPNLMNSDLENSFYFVCVLGTSKLEEIHRGLLHVSQYASEFSSPDIKSKPFPNQVGFQVKGRISCNSISSYVLLDEDSLCMNSRKASTRDALLAWVFSGPSSEEHMESWKGLTQKRKDYGNNLIGVLNKWLTEHLVKHQKWELRRNRDAGDALNLIMFDTHILRFVELMPDLKRRINESGARYYREILMSLVKLHIQVHLQVSSDKDLHRKEKLKQEKEVSRNKNEEKKYAKNKDAESSASGGNQGTHELISSSHKASLEVSAYEEKNNQSKSSTDVSKDNNEKKDLESNASSGNRSTCESASSHKVNDDIMAQVPSPSAETPLSSGDASNAYNESAPADNVDQQISSTDGSPLDDDPPSPPDISRDIGGYLARIGRINRLAVFRNICPDD